MFQTSGFGEKKTKQNNKESWFKGKGDTESKKGTNNYSSIYPGW